MPTSHHRKGNYDSDDLYEVLGVDRTASIDAIRDAYRYHAKQTHPDTDKNNDGEHFKKVQTAYDTLKDPISRHKYDTTGEIDDNIEKMSSMAREYVLKSLESVVNKSLNNPAIDISTQDFVSMMKSELMGNLQIVTKNIASLDHVKNRLAKMASKFKTKKGRKTQNFLKSTLDGQVQQFERNHASALEQKEAVTKAIELLDDFEYAFDKMPVFTHRINYGGGIFGTSSSSTTWG